MKKIKTENAVGLPLCNDVTCIKDGFKGPAFRRGHVITEDDIPKLLDLGKKTVFIWEENAGEIHEEEAAHRLYALSRIPGTHSEGPLEGKIQLISDIRGMFRVNAGLLRKINSLGDITITSLPDHYPVEAGDRMASMRIVPLVTRKELIEEAERLCEREKLFDMLPYRNMTAGVIITGSEIYSGRIKDRFEPVVREKLKRYPSRILGVTVCDDDLDMITDAAGAFLEQGADLLIFTGGMSVDPDDLTPHAVRTLGAQVISRGVPSQPGNMTMVAYIGETAVLGVPGAAVSLPATVFDVLLPQIFAGVRFTKEDLMNLAEGGLCQQCDQCRFPNCTFGRY